MIDVVANMRSGIVAHLETTVDALSQPLIDLHWVAMPNGTVSCCAWYAFVTTGVSLAGILPAQALSMANRHLEGAKPELSLTTCNTSVSLVISPMSIGARWRFVFTVASACIYRTTMRICSQFEVHIGVQGIKKTLLSISCNPST